MSIRSVSPWRTDSLALGVGAGVALCACILNSAALDATSAGTLWLRLQYERSPCDADAAIRLFDRFKVTGERQGALAVSGHFRAGCNPDLALLGREFALAMESGDPSAALAAAEAAVSLNPDSAEAHAWRAAARLAAGDVEGSIQDRRIALSLQPEPSADMAWSLATTLDSGGRACAAMEAWSLMGSLDREYRQSALRAQVELSPRCPGWELRGQTVLRSTVIDGWHTLPVSFGEVDAALGLDGSALWTMISADFAAEIGLQTDPEPVYLNLEGKVVEARVGEVSALRIGTLVLPKVTVWVVPQLPQGLRGVLGQNVLARVEIEKEGGTRWRIGAS